MAAPTLTRVPAVLSELEHVLTAALPDVTVTRRMVGELPNRLLFIAHPGTDGNGVAATVSAQQGLGARLREDFTVHVLVSIALPGVDDITPAMDACAAVLGTLDETLRTVRRPAVWDRIDLSGRMQWQPLWTPAGVECNVLADVEGVALL